MLVDLLIIARVIIVTFQTTMLVQVLDFLHTYTPALKIIYHLFLRRHLGLGKFLWLDLMEVWTELKTTYDSLNETQ